MAIAVAKLDCASYSTVWHFIIGLVRKYFLRHLFRYGIAARDKGAIEFHSLQQKLTLLAQKNSTFYLAA